MYFFQLSRRKPARVKQFILGGVRRALGPDYDVAAHFTPRYNPWISDVAWCRTATCSRRSGQAGIRRDLRDRYVHHKRHPPEGRQ